MKNMNNYEQADNSHKQAKKIYKRGAQLLLNKYGNKDGHRRLMKSDVVDQMVA